METGFRSSDDGTNLPFMKSDKRKEIDEIGPQVLTMDHLGLGFLVCLIPLGLAIVLFSWKLLFIRLKKKLFWLKNKLTEEAADPGMLLKNIFVP